MQRAKKTRINHEGHEDYTKVFKIELSQKEVILHSSLLILNLPAKNKRYLL